MQDDVHLCFDQNNLSSIYPFMICIRCTHHPFLKGFRSKYYEILATLT